MPSATLPNFTAAQVESHNSAKSCYVIVGENVYDVTDFLDAHPGGSDLILDYAGKDVTDILRDEDSHTHSEAAYEVLDDSLVGFLATTHTINGNGKAVNGKAVNGKAINGKPVTNGSVTSTGANPSGNGNGSKIHPRTGMSSEEDLSKDTDVASDYKKHKFLDLSRPLFPQIWFGGFSKEFYLDQVHRPRHYKGGESAPLFGNFLEPLTKTAWWVVPTLWLPVVSYFTWYTNSGFSSSFTQAAFWLLGWGLWTLVEYFLHRCLFHLDDYLPDNRVGITMHFLFHGIHHYLPMDKYRLVMPPVLLVTLATPWWKIVHIIFFWDWNVATTVFCGGIFGYILYDITHYFLHHQNLPLWYKGLKKYHLAHHFLDYELGFGVTSRFWDDIFGTTLPMTPVVKTQ